jgi:iron-sulfur cluster assembly protein
MQPHAIEELFCMITITPQAAAQIREAATQNDSAEMPLRVAARLDVDGSIIYGMGFDEERENDMSFQVEGIDVLVASVSEALLTGATIDFVEYQPGDFRFIFINPNDRAGSSCGTSGGSGGGCGGGCGSGGGCA